MIAKELKKPYEEVNRFMKTKVLSLFLAISMLFSMTGTVFADGGENPTGGVSPRL